MKPYENTQLYHHKECNTIITLYPVRSSSARLEIRILNVILYGIFLMFYLILYRKQNLSLLSNNCYWFDFEIRNVYDTIL